MGFLARDPVAATGMGVPAGTWATVALTTLRSPPGATSAGLGPLLLTAAVAMHVPASSATASELARHGAGRTAVRGEGPLAAGDLAAEAGVRPQL